MQDSIIRAASAVVAAASFSSAVVALSWAWADLSVRAELARIEPAGFNNPTPERIGRVVTRLKQARALQPLNADFAADLARVHAWRAWQTQGIPETSAAYRRASIESYRDAVRLRPTWGFAWISLAEANMLAGRNNDESRYALLRAMELAPLESATQLKALFVGFSLWDTLSIQTRNVVRATLHNAVSQNNHVDRIIRLAIQTDRTAELAGLFKQQRHRDLYERLRNQATN